MDFKNRRPLVLSTLSFYAIGMITWQMISMLYVHGEKKFETKKHWGYFIACDHILYIHDVTVTECAEECLYRMNCKAVNYIVHHKYCELCANDADTSGDVRRSGGVYIRRSEIKQETLTQGCNCAVKETCRENEGVFRCIIEECGQPPLIGATTKILGNRRQKASKVKYFCEYNGNQYNFAQSSCQDNGEWVVPGTRCDSAVYEGCYVDAVIRVLIGSTLFQNAMMTIEMCENYCVQSSYTYFGLEFYRFCFCGNGLPSSTKKNDNECNTRCSGNNEQMCGGTWRLSVYSIPS